MRVAALAYSVIDATDLSAWRRFAGYVADSRQRFGGLYAGCTFRANHQNAAGRNVSVDNCQAKAAA